MSFESPTPSMENLAMCESLSEVPRSFFPKLLGVLLPGFQLGVCPGVPPQLGQPELANGLAESPKPAGIFR